MIDLTKVPELKSRCASKKFRERFGRSDTQFGVCMAKEDCEYVLARGGALFVKAMFVVVMEHHAKHGNLGGFEFYIPPPLVDTVRLQMILPKGFLEWVSFYANRDSYIQDQRGNVASLIRWLIQTHRENT